MPAALLLPEHVRQLEKTHGFYEDFEEFVSGDVFTDTSADTGAAVASVDAAGGQVALTTGATDNNECALHTTNETFLFAADKPLTLRARVKWGEANVDDANVFVGLMDAPGANSLVDNGAGPKASFSGAGFFKVDGGTRWKTITSLGAAQTITDLTALNSLDKTAKTATGGGWQVLRIDFRPIDSTRAEIDFYLDGVLVFQEKAFTFTSATEMKVAIINKAGDTNSEVLYVDYVTCWQTR